jgi:hypothetical protein
MSYMGRLTRDPDLGARLIAALRQALRERHLDVADALLKAIEIHGVDHTIAAAYLLVAEVMADTSGSTAKRRVRSG